MTLLSRSHGPTHDIPYVDIRLDNDVIVFRGPASESVGGIVEGHVAMCIKEVTTIRSLKLMLQGVKRLHWVGRTPSTAGLIAPSGKPIKHEEVFYERSWSFIDGHGHGFTMAPNNYEFPFSQALAGDLDESVEGLGNTHVIYRFKIKIVRGTFQHDITAKKFLRIIRTLDPSAIEFAQSMNVENTWPEKIEYNVMTTSGAVVFGTHIPIEIELVPLLKGLVLGNVICKVMQTMTLDFPSPRCASYSKTKTILTETFESPFVCKGEVEVGVCSLWTMMGLVPLPKSLNECVQDCEVEGIKVRHKLKFQIQLHNPDGHTSELRTSLPLTLFISPSELLGPNGAPATSPLLSTDPPASSHQPTPPPTYDVHYFDRLYSDLSLDAFETPTHSGSTTPAGVLSRTNSAEDLHSLTSESSSTPLPPMLPVSNFFPLQSRPPSPSPPSPEQEVDFAELSKVPSYNTALAAGTRNLLSPDLPGYEGVGVSAPVMPQGSPPHASSGFFLRPRLTGRTASAGVVLMGRIAEAIHHGPSSRASVDTIRSSSSGGILGGVRGGLAYLVEG